MPSIRTETLIEAPLADVWAALSAWGAIHERLVPGFVVDCRLDGNDRIVTFFNGAEVRERLIDCDEESHRLVWSIVDGPYTHHNGAAELSDEGDGGTRFVWTADLLPAELAEPTVAMMEQGTQTIKKTLESA
ncbi:MAG: hypothetical protein QOG09_748 [Solirubrobacterales bacterium]|jgi:uncharacterized protein YndB with AHSA1/START domain|nr:hypothetical protein [Solirubrobacterales bacterium]MDX6662646.1 hypothetical protein [Solirubrobacterales bacterium]